MANQTKVKKAYTANTGVVNTFSWSGGFEVFKSTEVDVFLDDVTLTYTSTTINESASPREYTVDIAAKTVHIGGADLTAGEITIQADTDVSAARAVYQGGSSVASGDLNANQNQLLRKLSENQLSDATSFTTGDTAPTNPGDGDVWYDSVGGRTYVYYVDVDSGQWVESAPPFDVEGETTLSNLTFTQTGAGAVGRTTDSRLKDKVSVKDFGAKGDGATDDTAAIVLAINSAANNVIYFPSGTYLTTSTITPANSVSFKGEKNSFIKWDGSNGGTMFNASDPTKTIDSIDTLNIYGWTGSGSNYAKIGLEYGHNNTGTFGNIFRDVTFAYFQGSGSGYALRGHPNTDADGTTYTNGANDFKFYECSFSNSDNACSFGLPDHEFHGCNIKVSNTKGISILSNARVRFFGGYNSPTSDAFILANNCVGLNCYGVWFEGGDILGYSAGGACNVYDNVSFYDCHLATTNTDHIFDFSQITGGTITVKGGALGVLTNWPTVGKGVIKLQHAIPISVEDVAEPSSGHGTPRVISFVNTSGSTGHNLLTIKRNGLTSFAQLAVPTLSRENSSTYGDIKFANDKGIDFSLADDTATGETTTNSKLTDYEEGTFTPTVLGSSSNPTITYHANTYACYVKIGTLVHLDFKIIMSAYSGGSGNVLIGGLPYVSKSATHYQSHGHLSYERINHDAGERIFLRLGANTSSINLSAVNDDADMSDIPVGELTTGGSNRILKGSISYITDA
jgi:hypothetical protein